MLFNDAEQLGVSDIQQGAGLEAGELKRVLLSLASGRDRCACRSRGGGGCAQLRPPLCWPRRLLIKEPKGKDIGDHGEAGGAVPPVPPRFTGGGSPVRASERAPACDRRPVHVQLWVHVAPAPHPCERHPVQVCVGGGARAACSWAASGAATSSARALGAHVFIAQGVSGGEQAHQRGGAAGPAVSGIGACRGGALCVLAGERELRAHCDPRPARRSSRLTRPLCAS